MKKRNVFFNKIESFLISISLIGIIFLIGLQIFINHGTLSLIMNENKIVDNSLVLGSEYTQKGVIELKIEDSEYKNVEVLIDGKRISTFKNKLISLDVDENNIIEINGTMYDEQIKVKIVGLSNNIKSLKLNTVIYITKSIEMLGKVKFK